MKALPTVAIVDGTGSNIASLRFALERLGSDSVLTTDADVIRRATHVILPGVGSAASAMTALRAAGLDRLIPGLTQPVLGICLGMQLLFDASEEDDTRCLGIMAGSARRFVPAPGRPVPHMGWNQLRKTAELPLLAGVPDGASVYFVHSYALAVGAATGAIASYGVDFTAVAQERNFVATQFHPERSGETGSQILGNFLTLY